MKCMILAAGRGERLRPITDRIPKPLVEAGGRPLIVHHLEKLRSCGISDIVINTAWLGEKLEEYLGNGALNHEEKALLATLQLYALGQQGSNKVSNDDSNNSFNFFISFHTNFLVFCI